MHLATSCLDVRALSLRTNTALRRARVALSDEGLARFAVESLIEEAQLTPKPALVDARGSGAHRDLDLPLMLRSARALEPTFAALARASRGRVPSATLRAELAQLGRAGEQQMMHATGGSNAHRGAIWIVGLLVAGAVIALDDEVHPMHAQQHTHAARVCELGSQIACFPDRFASLSPSPHSHGERARRQYGVGGARQEAQDGFPHVIGIGLPALHAARAKGIVEDAARLDTLFAIMASLDDTCLLHRAGLEGLHAGQRGARAVLAAGGTSTAQGRAALATLERELMSLNASPGGSADLLAATLFIDRLTQHAVSRS